MTYKFHGAVLGMLLALTAVPVMGQEIFDQDFAHAMQLVEQDPPQTDKAIPLLKKSAERGNREAAYNLGVALYQNAKSPAALEETARWFKQASDAGDVRAHFNLATVYEDMKPLPVAPQILTSLYMEAAEAGIVQAMHRFGVIKMTGQYGATDKLGGLAWILLAAGYEDGDIKSDLDKANLMTTDDEKKTAKDFAAKLRSRLEKNPEFLNNMSL